MSTIAEQLQELATIKEAIRQAIIAKGVTVSSDAAFSTYATAIWRISGGDDTEFIKLIEKLSSTYTFPVGLTRLGSRLFQNDQTITSLKLPEGVTTIGNDAFNNAKNLDTIDLPSTVTSIESNAFVNATGVTTFICRAETPPSTISTSFGSSDGSYMGRANYSSGTNKFYVPYGKSALYAAVTSGGLPRVFDATKCNFSIVELNSDGQIPDPNSL